MKRHLLPAIVVFLWAACGSKTPESGTTASGAGAGGDEAAADEAAVDEAETAIDEAVGDEGEATVPVERVQARVQELRTACLGDRDAVVGMLVYRGDDIERRWKVPRKPSDPDTKKTVEQVCAHLTGKEELAFGRMKVEQENEGVWMALFVYGTKGQVTFAFLEVDGVLLLGDVDK